MPSALFTTASDAWHDAALRRALGEDTDEDATSSLATLLGGGLGRRPRIVELAAESVARAAAHRLLTHGWTPAELHAFARRRLDDGSLSYVHDALAAAAQWSAASRWIGQLGAVGARVWWTVGEPHLGQWAAQQDLTRAAAIDAALNALALLCFAPHTDDRLPGTPIAPDLPGGVLVLDPRIVARIDALLARAGDPSFPDEAAACAVKAAELMARYAVESARPSAGPRGGPVGVATTIGAESVRFARFAATVITAPLRRVARTAAPTAPRALI